jgi:hypothetical protein
MTRILSILEPLSYEEWLKKLDLFGPFGRVRRFLNFLKEA